MMKKNDFAFTVPSHLIAKYPCSQRSGSRLLHVKQDGFEDLQFQDIGRLLRANDLLVFNDTAVIAARLYARKESGARLEVLLNESVNDHQAWVLLKPSAAVRCADRLRCANGNRLVVRQRCDNLFLLEALDQTWSELIEEQGSVPLPPYLHRAAEPLDKERYQTVYARHPGSVAAPTAGLHFDQPLIDSLQPLGVCTAKLTLHIGYGTFQPIRAEQVEHHRMHEESFIIDQSLAAAVAQCRQAGGRVVAVGTTVVRALESAATSSSELHTMNKKTDLFIYPGYRFRIVDALISNFHVSQSSLFVLVCAFAGRKHMLAAYQHAIKHQYRFLSYGDAMFVERNEHSD